MPLGRLGNYEILEKVGQGGMGVVLKARDTRLDRVVALKVIADELASDPEYRARLLREARAEASLNHPAIATCYETGEGELDPPDLLHPGSPAPSRPASFIAMEYVPGSDLPGLVGDKPLAIPRVLDLAIQIASGLEAAHKSGVIHRDLKPGNVRVTPEGQVKILDFGLARVRAGAGATAVGDSDSVRTTEGRIMGTAPYMAPEQARGQQVDARSDLFSFGVLLYEIITGRRPFGGANSVEVMYSVANDDPPPLARFAHGVPDELERIVGKLLAKQPDDRYQSAHEVLTDLRLLREAVQPPSGGHLAMRARPRRGLFVAGFAALAIVVAVAAWWAGHARLTSGSRSIAVLGFENQSGDSTLDYVATGLADEVLGDLVQHSNLNVISRAAVAGVRPAGKPLKTVAHELGVSSILTGAFRGDEAGPRLTVELIHAPSGRVEWSGAYDYSIEEVFRIKRGILEQIASHLSARLDFASSGQGAADATRSLKGYDLYMQGIRELEESDAPRSDDRAADLFGQALALDPEFARAWAGRSRALIRIYARDKRAETLRSSERAADRAIELAPGLLEARVARAEMYRVTGRNREAIAELEGVLKVKPNWDEAYRQLAATYRDAGRLQEAERSYRRAIELRPDYWRHWNALGAVLIKRGNYAGARAAFTEIVRIVPDQNRGYEQLAVVSMYEGKYEQAIAEYRRMPTPVNDATLASNIASAFFYTGRLGEARDYYALAARLEPENPIWQRNIGDLYTRQGRETEARACYRTAVRLAEAALRVNPADTDLRMRHILCLAKAGDCEAARRGLAAFPAGLVAGVSEHAYAAAMVHSLCGERAPALAALRRAAALGIARDRIRGDVEFHALAGDPEFVRIAGAEKPGGAGGAPPR